MNGKLVHDLHSTDRRNIGASRRISYSADYWTSQFSHSILSVTSLFYDNFFFLSLCVYRLAVAVCVDVLFVSGMVSIVTGPVIILICLSCLCLPP